MDYEEKYKEALDRAKALIAGETNTSDALFYLNDIKSIFPEFQYSEDELTWLTRFIKEEAYSLSMDIRDNEDRIKLKNLQKSLAWLEKQGKKEQDPCEHCNDKCLNCYNFPCVDKREFERGKSAMEAIKEENVDNTNKVEPKFKDSDGIIYEWDEENRQLKKIKNTKEEVDLEHEIEKVKQIKKNEQ